MRLIFFSNTISFLLITIPSTDAGSGFWSNAKEAVLGNDEDEETGPQTFFNLKDKVFGNQEEKEEIIYEIEEEEKEEKFWQTFKEEVLLNNKEDEIEDEDEEEEEQKVDIQVLTNLEVEVEPTPVVSERKKGKEDKKPDSKDPSATDHKSPDEKSEDSMDIPDELSAPMLGALHNVAFAALGEMLESNSGTTDEIFVLRNLATLLGSTCKPRDFFCKANLYRMVVEAFYNSASRSMLRSGVEEIPWPEDFGEELPLIIDTAKEIVTKLDYTNTDDVLVMFGELIEDVAGIEIENEAYKAAVTSILSVAQSGTELWTQTAQNAVSPLHQMSRMHTCSSSSTKDSLQRRLQLSDKITLAIEAGIEGAIQASKEFFIATILNADSLEDIDITKLLNQILLKSITASAAAFFGSNI